MLKWNQESKNFQKLNYGKCFRIPTKLTYKVCFKDSVISQEAILTNFELWNLEMDSK